MDKRNASSRLAAEDWCRAALLAFGEQGERAFSVEPLARRLGVTKGSFYWHFSSKAELIDRALELWRDEGTGAIIAELERDPDPRTRLVRLLAMALRDTSEARAEAALQAAAARGHARIGPVVNEVNRSRLAYLAGLYAKLGRGPAWADAAYAGYLGACQLLAMEEGALASARREGLVEHLVLALVPPSDVSDVSGSSP